jgi:hypothetical protein
MATATTNRTKTISAARAKRLHDKAKGNCYESALHLMYRLCTDGNPDQYRLVHAEIIGQGPIEGLAHGHAFVTDIVNDIVMDESNGRELRMDSGIYEALARISVHGNVHVYTWDEAVEKAFDTGHYGPWDLVTSTGL